MGVGEYQMNQNDKYPMVREMPDGWKVLLNATTAPKGYIWITNNEPQFSGRRKYALLETTMSVKEIIAAHDCIGKC